MEEEFEPQIGGVEPLWEIVRSNGTYVFDYPYEPEEKKDAIENMPEFQDFDVFNLVEVVAWLDDVEKYARLNNLSRKGVLLLIGNTLEEKCAGEHFFTEDDIEFKTMLDVKMYIIRKLFDQPDLLKLVITVLKGTHEARTLENLLAEVVKKCRAIGIASMSLETRTGFNSYTLMSSLVCALPPEVTEKYMNNLSEGTEPSIKHIMDFIVNEIRN